jgi:hypothetical protein
MEEDYEECISRCERGTFCSGYDCFKAGYDAGFKNQQEVLDNINKVIAQAKMLEQKLKELMEVADKEFNFK